jgi:hypothetical protein
MDYPITWAVTDYTSEVFTASIGDTVTFSWGGTHNVFLHPTGTCDAAGATEVGSRSGVVYMFTAAGSFTFACEVGQHCGNGQILTFTVTDPLGGGLAAGRPFTVAGIAAPIMAMVVEAASDWGEL